jgi:cell division protein FtsW (lipid II flippase)
VTTLVLYFVITLLSLYVAVASQGYVVTLAFVVGGVAFFFFQVHVVEYSLRITTAEKNADSSGKDDDTDLRLPPA